MNNSLMKPRRAHVAPPLRERMEVAKASRRREREVAISNRLAAAQSERLYALARAEASAVAAQEAADRLRALAGVLPHGFIGVAAAKLRHTVSNRDDRVWLESPPQPSESLFLNLSTPALMNIMTVEAVQAAVDTHYNEMRRMMHVVLQVAVPGDPRVGYAITLESLMSGPPKALARVITQEMQPALAQQLAEFQVRAKRGY